MLHSGLIQVRRPRLSESPSQRTDAGSCQAYWDADEGVLGRRTSPAVEPTFRLPPRIRAKDRAVWSTMRSLSSLPADAGMVRALVISLPRPVRSCVSSVRSPPTHQSRLRLDCHKYQVRSNWAADMQAEVLYKAGYGTNTSRDEEAAHLLAELGLSTSTWTTRPIQVVRLIRF